MDAGQSEEKRLNFRMLAVDYDRTIATDGKILPNPQSALVELKEAAWHCALVTGRELDDLFSLCPAIGLFDLLVAENGAVLYLSDTKEIIDRAAPPSPLFTAELQNLGIPFSSGRVIVATGSAHVEEVALVINRLKLDLKPILNKDSAMYLPAGIDKATGLAAGAQILGIDLSEVIGIGDAENDLVFLRACGYSVAVNNAIDQVKKAADYVTALPYGDGVATFIRECILRQDELVEVAPGAASATD